MEYKKKVPFHRGGGPIRTYGCDHVPLAVVVAAVIVVAAVVFACIKPSPWGLKGLGFKVTFELHASVILTRPLRAVNSVVPHAAPHDSKPTSQAAWQVPWRHSETYVSPSWCTSYAKP